MDTVVFPPGLYDRLLESVRFDDPEEVLQRIEDHLSLSPGHAKKTKRAVSHLLAPIVQLRKYNLLESLTPTLLKHGVPVHCLALKAAVALPIDLAKVYLDKLFALGWDVNTALSNTEPPVLSMALEDISLAHWLLGRGADPNAPCDIDLTPLSVAVRDASIPVIELLLQHAQHCHNGHLVFYATQRPDVNESTRLICLLQQSNKPIDEILHHDARSYQFRAQFACVRYDQIVGPSPREVARENGWSNLVPHEGRRIDESQV
ncbi:hypothetical protein BST61_g2015 [Cercospora zeina]